VGKPAAPRYAAIVRGAEEVRPPALGSVICDYRAVVRQSVPFHDHIEARRPHQRWFASFLAFRGTRRGPSRQTVELSQKAVLISQSRLLYRGILLASAILQRPHGVQSGEWPALSRRSTGSFFTVRWVFGVWGVARAAALRIG